MTSQTAQERDTKLADVSAELDRLATEVYVGSGLQEHPLTFDDLNTDEINAMTVAIMELSPTWQSWEFVSEAGDNGEYVFDLLTDYLGEHRRVPDINDWEHLADNAREYARGDIDEALQRVWERRYA